MCRLCVMITDQVTKSLASTGSSRLFPEVHCGNGCMQACCSTTVCGNVAQTLLHRCQGQKVVAAAKMAASARLQSLDGNPERARKQHRCNNNRFQVKARAWHHTVVMPALMAVLMHTKLQPAAARCKQRPAPTIQCGKPSACATAR